MVIPSLLECVPNVSAGRDVVLVDGLGDVIRDAMLRGGQVDGSVAQLVDVHRDADHDRSVFTLLGYGEALIGGVASLASAAVERINLHGRRGVHPCVGVLDVVPVVALDSSSSPAAFEAMRMIAGRIGSQLHVPVVRYGLDEDGEQVSGAGRTGLVRRGESRAVMERVGNGELELLAGPGEPHPTAGVTMCGVRDVLVAFNVDLDTHDVEIARGIASRIREIGGSDALPGVRALGLELPSRGIVQVSTNIERHAECGPARVVEVVVRLAKEAGVSAASAELVGLAPDSALAPLRYACTRHGVALATGPRPSLDAAIAHLRHLSSS